MPQIQIDQNLVEGIVAGKCGRIDEESNIFPRHAKRVENSPPGGNNNKWIVEHGNAHLADLAPLDFPKQSKVQRVTPAIRA